MKKVTRIFWHDNDLWRTQCPFCREVNQGRRATMIHSCVHLVDADWTFGKAVFRCEDTGIHCPACLEKFKATEGIRLRDDQILCGKCGLESETKVGEI